MVCLLTPSKQKSEEIENNSAKNNSNPTDNKATAMDDSMNASDDNLCLKRIAGGSLISQPPLYSSDGQTLYILEKNIVHVYSATTGEWIRDFESASHDIVSLEYDFDNWKILVGCTKFGELLRWRSKNGAIENKGSLNMKHCEVQSFNLLNMWTSDETPHALVIYKTVDNDDLQWKIIDINSGQAVNCRVHFKLSDGPVKVQVDIQKFNYFAIAQGCYVYVVNYKNWRYKKCLSANRCPITTIKMHPSEEMFATGDEMGRVFLWRELYNVQYPVTTIYHWHHTAITSIAFTVSGTGFYTSGEEAVLVQWNMHRPGHKNFLPRMSSIILHIAISPENESFAVCTADNGIQILGAENESKCTVQNFTYVCDDKTQLEKFPLGLKLNPRTNCIVLNGRNGHLQFYSTHTKSLLYNVDIVLQNRLSRESAKILYDIRVTHADFNINWMATGEIYDDNQHLPELRLKFWEYQKENQSFALNTNIELPHEGGFKSIQFSSSYDVENLLCATAGADNKIKVWSLEDSDNIYKEGKVWYCIAQTSYKNLSIDSISFSQDGSLLSAGFGNSLCVYKAENLKLKAVLTPPTGYDGTVQKAQVHIPKDNLNGSKNDLYESKKSILKLFTNLLENNEETLIKEIKNKASKEKRPRKSVPCAGKVDEKQKERLYKKILSMTELNLFQKIILYQKLGIYCTVTENAQTKMLRYLQNSILSVNKTEEKLTRKIRTIGTKDRFKAKYRLSKYHCLKRHSEAGVDRELVPLLSLLNLKTSKTSSSKEKPYCNGKSRQNGVGALSENSNGSNVAIKPLPSVAAIKHVRFAMGEFAHLAIVCTENRLLIWNLLSLRLQCVLKVSVEHITIDPMTNLVAAFTKNRELYVFLPNTPLPLYHRKNLPKISGAIWVPRRYSKSQSINIDWQSMSTLYFLTADQQIMALVSENDNEVGEFSAAFMSEPRDSVRYSTFGAFAVKQMSGQSTTFKHGGVSIGVPGKSAIKSLTEMAAHTMPPLNLVCNQFLMSMVSITQENTESHKFLRKNETKNDVDSDDELAEKNPSLRKVVLETTKEIQPKQSNIHDEQKEEERLRIIAKEAIQIVF